MLPRKFRRALLGAIAVLAVALIYELTGAGQDDSPLPAGHSVTVEVDRVVDGDTAKVFFGGRSEYVRYIGIDTPESVKPGSPVECYGEEAKDFNQGLLARQPTVRLEFDREERDRYGRLLAYVYSGGTLLNAELLRRGYATTMAIPPNDSRAGQFERLERQARAAGRGLWSAC